MLKDLETGQIYKTARWIFEFLLPCIAADMPFQRWKAEKLFDWVYLLTPHL